MEGVEFLPIKHVNQEEDKIDNNSVISLHKKWKILEHKTKMIRDLKNFSFFLDSNHKSQSCDSNHKSESKIIGFKSGFESRMIRILPSPGRCCLPVVPFGNEALFGFGAPAKQHTSQGEQQLWKKKFGTQYFCSPEKFISMDFGYLLKSAAQIFPLVSSF